MTTNTINTTTQIPKTSRIGVIGAGPAGVSFTYFLRKQGFNNITLLESAPHISGKSSSFEVGGRGYDVGALMVGTNYHHIRSLASQLSCPLEPFKGRALDIEKNVLTHDDTSMICIYQKLLPHINHYLGERSHTQEIANPGHGTLSSEELYSPIQQYLKGKGMEYLRDAWALAYTSAGYGYIDGGDIPAAYFLKFIENSENNISYFPEGFNKLWEKMVEGVNVLTQAHVTKVDRSLAQAGVGPILVTYQNSQYQQTLAFDYIVIATNPKQALPFLDASAQETRLFKQLIYFDYYTIIATVDGLSTKQGLTTIPKYCQSKEYVGHITAFYCAHDGVPTYSFYAYGDAEITQEKVIEYFREDIAKMGGSLKEIHYCKLWDFFPHVNSLSMARGFYNKAECLQGQHNTFYTGGWLDLELTENCVSYSEDLVTRFFSDTPKESRHLPISPPIEVKPPAMENLALALKLAAEKCPEKVAFTWVDANLKEEMRFTYAQLYEQARYVAQFLVTKGHKKGDRVLLCYAPGLKFLPILFGCFMCGVIAVPVAPPNLSTAQKDIARFSFLVATTGARICFSDKDYLLYTRIYSSKALVGLVEKIKWPEDLTWIDGDNISGPLYDEKLIAEVDPHDVAVLQFSSGSTGDPKGVMLTHRNLLHNVDLMQAETGINADSIFAFWVPQFHDLGLIGGFLNTVRAASRSIVMSPLTFLQRPEVWLQMISKYRANFTAAPNFAYELAARKCSDKTLGSLDLSSLIGAFNGAEPVRWSTLHAFSQKFSNAGFNISSFKCLYGLAEHCAYTVGFRNSHGVPTVIDVDPQDLLSGRVTLRSNPSMPNRIVATGVPNTAMQVEVRIVDPDTRLLCPPNVVGEVWISSPSVGEGYYGKEELSEEVFRAKLHNDDDDDDDDDQDRDRGCFLRTGDLGFMYKGQLFITGRLKDVIIINGKNHYPHDIELTTQQCHPQIRPGCVAALHHHDPSRGTDALIILAEIRDDRDKVGLGTIVHEINRMVPANHGLSAERVVLLKPHSIPKTTSGKLQRARAKAMLMAGDLDKKIIFNDGDFKEKAKPDVLSPVAVTLTIAQISETITRRVQKISKLVPQTLSEIDENANLITTYGLDSLAAVQLTSSLKDDFGVEIPPSLLYDIPTISGLAKHVAKLSAVQRSDSSDTLIAASPSSPSSPTFTQPSVSLAEIESTIGSHIQKLSRIAAKLEKPDPKANIITDYGFDSLAAVQLTALIKTSFEVEVAPAILYDIYTISALASHVYSLIESQSPQQKTKRAVQDHEILTPKETPLLVPLAPRNVSNKNNSPLFCIHPLLGNVAAYVHLSRVVGITRPVYGIQSPSEFPPSIAILAKRYAALIQRDQPSGPYYLCGYSYGGLIAWEIGKHLAASGEKIGGLFLIDAPSPLSQTVKEPVGEDKEAHLVWEEEIEQLLSDVDSQWMMRKRASDPAQIADLKRLIGKHIQAMYAHTGDITTLSAVQPFPVHYWRAKDLSKTSTLLLDHPDFHDRHWGWRSYKGSITFYNNIPGHHYSVLTEDNCGRLGRELDRAIPKYTRRTSAELRPLMLEKVAKVANKDRPYSTRSCKSSRSPGNLLDVLNLQIPLYCVIAITIAISYTMQRITTIVI